MRPAGKKQGPRNAAGVVLPYVEDVLGNATTPPGMQTEPKQMDCRNRSLAP